MKDMSPITLLSGEAATVITASVTCIPQKKCGPYNKYCHGDNIKLIEMALVGTFCNNLIFLLHITNSFLALSHYRLLQMI
jgi:hypothetical protein